MAKVSGLFNEHFAPNKNNLVNRSPYWQFEKMGWSGIGDEALESVRGEGKELSRRTLNRTLHYNSQLTPDNPDSNRIRLPGEGSGGAPPEWIAKVITEDDWPESFETGDQATLVDFVAFNEKHNLLLIRWKKARTGKHWGIPPGSTTVYDNVPKYVYDTLARLNEAQGRVGEAVWQLIRGRTTESLYPYTNLAE